MTLKDLERRGVELRTNFARGAITEEEFRAGINSLRFQDSQNRWWMLGAQSNKWYQFDGTRWIPGTPPEIPASLPLAAFEPKPAPPADFTPQYPTPDVAEPAPMPYTPPQPPTLYTQTQYTPETVAPPAVVEPARGADKYNARPFSPSAAAPVDDLTRFTPPESVTQVIRRHRRRESFPTSLLVGIGAIAVIIILAALLFAVDTFASGKPISTFVERTFGTTPPGVIPPPTGLPANVIAMITSGDQAFDQGQVDSAIAQYVKAMQAAPGSSAPLVRLTRAYSFKGQTQDAIARGKQAVKISPNDAEAAAQLCRALTWDGQVDEATKTCEGAIKLDSKNLSAHAFLTEAYLFAHRLTDAKAQATLAVQLAPQSAEAHRAQAWMLTLSGQKDQAAAEWNQTMTLEPTLFFRYYEAAEVTRVFFNDIAGAIPNYQRALVLNNSYLPAIIRLGTAYVDVNQPQSAIPHLRRAATLTPNNPDVMAYLGLAYAKTNQCSQGIPYFEQALKVDANNSVAQRGETECKTGTPSGPAPAPPALTVPILSPTAIPAPQ